MIWILVIWLIGAIVAFFAVINKWENKSISEKIIFSLIWPMLLIFYVIHIIYNKWVDKHKKKTE